MKLNYNWPDDVYATIDDYKDSIPENVLEKLVQDAEPIDFDEKDLDDVMDQFCEDIAAACDEWLDEHEEE